MVDSLSITRYILKKTHVIFSIVNIGEDIKAIVLNKDNDSESRALKTLSINIYQISCECTHKDPPARALHLHLCNTLERISLLLLYSMREKSNIFKWPET